MIPTTEDFTSRSYNHEVVRREEYERGEERRFHLSFAYINERGTVSVGDQVKHARDMGQAAVRIAQERGVTTLFVCKRHESGQTASEAAIINRVFDIA